jgi:hypothetical protein
MSQTEARHRTKDVANAAALVRDAAESAATDGPTVVHTPYGKAVVHVDEHGADVRLPGGRTVHVRFGGKNSPCDGA